MVLVLVTLLLALAPQDPATAKTQQLHAELARVIDLPTAAARVAAADELAAKKVASLAEWTAACASFGTFAKLDAGPSRHVVPLQVLDQVVDGEVFLYVPPSYDIAKPAPLLLWGHGAGGTGAREHLLWQAVADKIGMLVLAVTSVDAEPGYHFSPGERAAWLAALRWARRQANVDENAIFAGGWSQGGHQTWDLILRHPDVFAGALPVVGGPRLELGPKNNLRYLENAWHLPIRDLQGSKDDALLLDNLRMAFVRLKKFGAKDAQLIELADRGHDADLAAVDWPAFFALRRTPQPRRVVRVAAEPSETRAFWLEVTRWSQRASPGAIPEVVAGFDTMNEPEQRAHTLDRYADVTARLAVDDKGHGRFVATGKLVSAFTLLLTPAQLGKDGAVEVQLQNKPIRKKAVPEVVVLLREFVERFDRTFLPVARVQVP
jgi:pimeloyl-ACP methyl ester carboxylesterase